MTITAAANRQPPEVAPSMSAVGIRTPQGRVSSTSWIWSSASITARIAAVRYQTDSRTETAIRPALPCSRIWRAVSSIPLNTAGLTRSWIAGATCLVHRRRLSVAPSSPSASNVNGTSAISP
jgi:hypothetical protein